MNLKIEPNEVADLAKKTQIIAIAQDSKPKAVAAVGTLLSGAINVMAALVGKRQPDGDMATRINPVSVMYAAVLLAKMNEGAEPVPGGESLIAINIDVGRGSFKSALDIIEKIHPDFEEYLDEEMLSGIRNFTELQDRGISSLPEPLRKLMQEAARRLH